MCKNYIDKMFDKGLIKCKMYRYAPEGFKLYIDGAHCSLSNPTDFGMLLIEGKDLDLKKAIKIFLRKHTVFSNRVYAKLHLKLSNGDEITPMYADCKNIVQKLEQYKQLKHEVKKIDSSLKILSVVIG
jgi:hypothetical protein